MVESAGFHPWVEKFYFPGEVNGYSRQYSCLKNPIDRETW